MHPCEAVRVAKKIVPWIPRLNHEWRAALETLIDLVESAQRDVDREVREEFGRLVDQIKEPA